MKTKLIVAIAIIVSYLLLAAFNVPGHIIGPLCCGVLAGVLFWPSIKQ
ncbi:hypothetical protein [Corynebacterium sp. HS2168-gen11]|nr:hypothetical protein [Corynebacterium sp. HS2168-gen11]MCS4536175.1 hypothetical protein [Corynebacterium sp. HS2168-gen11]